MSLTIENATHIRRKFINTLDLSYAHIGDTGAKTLSEAIKINQNIIILNLSVNNITFAGAIALAEALKFNRSITSINLGQNNINDDGIIALAEALKINQSITILNLSRISIGNSGVQSLSEALKINRTITTIDFSMNEIGDDGAMALAEALKINQSISTLNLSMSSIENGGAQSLSEALRINRTITTIDFSHNSIGDDGAMALAEAIKINQSISTLKLSACNIGNGGVQPLSEALKINRTITVFEFSNNVIGDDGAMALAEALKINQSITTLHLSCSSSIGNGGVQSLAEALKINRTITAFDFCSNLIADVGANALTEALKINKSIVFFRLSHCSMGNGRMQSLAEALKINQTITTFDLSCNSIGDDGAMALAEALKINQSITALDLSSNSIGNDGVQALAEALMINRTITAFDFSMNEIGDDGAMALAEALKVNQSITTLKLSDISVENDEVELLAEALKVNQTITDFDFSFNFISEDGAMALAKALKINQSITTLNLSCMNIGDDAMRALAETFKINRTITDFDFSQNFIRDDGAIALAKALKKNQSITTFKFSSSSFGNVGVQSLAEMLKINRTITDFDFSFNRISDDGAMALAEALKINQSIVFLKLCCCGMESGRVQSLAEALKINQSIATLNLSNNNIGNGGVQSLAEVLKINRTVTTIEFAMKETVDDGALNINRNITITTPNYKNIATGADDDVSNTHDMTTLNLPGKRRNDTGIRIPAESLNIDQSEFYSVKRLRKDKEKLESVDTAKKAKLRGKYAKNESGRLYTQSTVRDQKEHMEIIDATELSAVENGKLKGFVPTLSVIKIFDIIEAGDENQFDDYQAKVVKISGLMREGNNRLRGHGEKGILLLGNTGAGKSTLAHLLCGKKLQAVINNETKDMVIEAMQPLDDIIISHNLASETKIPIECFTKGVIIWDCPGFNATDPVQEIANNFYIKRLFMITDQIKLVLVITESDIRNKRGSDFFEILSNFMKYLKDFRSIEHCISLVVTQVSLYKNTRQIKKSIDKILVNNQKATPEHKELVNKLKVCSIHLFRKPNEEGVLDGPDLFRAIESCSKYCKAEEDMINISISKEAKACSSNLLNVVSRNFHQILEVIVEGISNVTKCSIINPLNVFAENYNLVLRLIPSSIHYIEYTKMHGDNEYFSKLDLLKKLQNELDCELVVSIPNAISIFQEAVEIIAEYVAPSNHKLQHKIQGYNHCLQQQYEYVNFFARVLGIELPNHTKIAKLISMCHASLTKTIEHEICSLNIDTKMIDPVYYLKAIDCLETFPDSFACRKNMAIAYCRLADIVDQNSVRAILSFCVRAIEADRRLPKIYEILGKRFYNIKEFDKAINCYKVVNNEYEIQKCFKAWLIHDGVNPDIMLKQAAHYDSIGLFEEAKKCYHYAFSLSIDDDFKAAVLEKIGNIMVNADAQGQDFISRARERHFYNFDLVDETFLDNLRMDCLRHV